MSSPASLVDEFENSFQSCLSSLTNPINSTIHDTEEIKTSVDLTIQRFLDVARQMECFFLQKRLLLSVQKPELILAEDCNELKNEIARKDQILQKYYEKLQLWQSILNDTVALGASPSNLQRQASVGLGPSAGAMPAGAAQPGPTPINPMPAGQAMAMRPPPVVTGQTHMMGAMPSQMASLNSPMTPPQVGPGPGMPLNMPPATGSMMPMQGPGGMLPPPPPPQGGGQPVTGQGMINQMGQGQMQQFMTQQPMGGLQSPLAYLERTTSNIGLPEPRR